MSAECHPGLASRRYKDNCPLKSSEIRFSTLQKSFNNR